MKGRIREQMGVASNWGLGMTILSLIILFLAILPSVFSFPFKDCPPPFLCGHLGNLSFPFTTNTGSDRCGPFVVDGCDRKIQTIQLNRSSGKRYLIQHIRESDFGYEISLTDKELQADLKSKNCDAFNWSLPSDSYLTHEGFISNRTTLYKCNLSTPSPTSDYVYFKNCGSFKIFYHNKSDPPTFLGLPPPPPVSCQRLQLPRNNETIDPRNIFAILTANFSLEVSAYPCHWCASHGGSCKFNEQGEFTECSRSKKGLAWKIGIGVGCGALFLIILVLAIFFLFNTSICGFKEDTRDHQSVESFLKIHGLMAPKRYKFSEIQKFTCFFKDILGEGGYGTVYKGKLPDGCLVAIKVLKESKSNGEEFINEVTSISRTSHVNIVTLLGFCLEGSKRALIYEFMFKGSLDNYIYKKYNVDCQLSWETLQQIAIGIARGLEYLHRGCNTRILHFDIKPQNILLDENFCPKISDFGLAKICFDKQSIISMLGARGTAGYIAPEVFCRNFGPVTHKSDVYSYGMLLFEMVGKRRDVCSPTNNSSDIYFPHWIFKRLEIGQELGIQGINTEE